MNFQKIDRWLYLQKEGMILGAVIGGAIYYFNITIPYLIFKSGISSMTKFTTLIFVGMTIGALVDSWIKPKV